MQKLVCGQEHLWGEVADEPRPLLDQSDPRRKLMSKNEDYCPASGLPIYMAALPNGKRVPLLKTLLSSACERNCYYCSCRSERDFERHTFKPDEMAETFYKLAQSGVVMGVFLSSAVHGGSIRTQDKLLETTEILRKKLGYRGYIHLKIMPGAERAQVERAMQLADRVSVNIEAPTSERLANLAPQKMLLDELLSPLRWVEEIRRSQPGHMGWNQHWPSSTTQFVVGGGEETDLELVRATEYLYNHLNLARAYFSAFSPVPGTPLEEKQPLNRWRQHRLYQASFLIKNYQFGLEDMPFTQAGYLPLDVDPKLAWARANLSEAPVELNRADEHELLRVPGIGVRGARAIIAARYKNRLCNIDDLKNLGILTGRAAPFILLNGSRQAFQLHLF